MSAKFEVWAVYSHYKRPRPFVGIVTTAKAVRVAVVVFDKPIKEHQILQWRQAIADMFLESYPALEIHCQPYAPLKKHSYQNVEYLSA